MHEPSPDPSQTTLSERLRDAAVDRARLRGDVIDEVSIDETGVIDLRIEPDPTTLGTSTTTLSPALAATQGGLDSVHDVSDLYAPEHETRRGWWRRSESLSSKPASPLLAGLPAGEEIDLDELATSDTVARDSVDPSTTAADRAAPTIAAPVDELDIRDRVRPTGRCASCGGRGQRDLFDPFSQTDYFSCDDCQTMWQAPHG